MKLEILVVDDSELARDLLCEYLKEIASCIETAHDGVVALEKLTDQSICFDIIISDLHMPRMNGLELLKEVRNDIRYGSVPFILVTAASQDRGIEKLAHDLGASEVLEKSFSEKRIRNIVLNCAIRAL